MDLNNLIFLYLPKQQQQHQQNKHLINWKQAKGIREEKRKILKHIEDWVNIIKDNRQLHSQTQLKEKPVNDEIQKRRRKKWEEKT